MNDTIAKKIDILEEEIKEIHPSLLNILLKDKTTRDYILWGTKDYEELGTEFSENMPIYPKLVTGMFARVIQPRAAKSETIRAMRVRTRAEVFTPSWICNEQNNLIDNAWFGVENVFNKPKGKSWIVTKSPVDFSTVEHKTWKNYVDEKRLEITCGEAPYLVSRYDTTTGKLIPVEKRIGLLDRKMRIVRENCKSREEWMQWAERAFQSIYGYEFQGDSVLIARENLLYTYIDYYQDQFNEAPPLLLLKKIANIIAWNIWQMDGTKYVVPYSCHEYEDNQLTLFDVGQAERHPCPGCADNNAYKHNGTYCKITDWRDKSSCTFISLIEGGSKHERL